LKLQKHTSRIVEGKEYSKWVIVIPSSQIDELGWSEGDELESIVKGNTLLLRPLLNPPEKPKKMAYEEFRDRIKELLKREAKGLTWTEIKVKLNFPQKVPNNLWVRMMETDIGLIREKVGTKTIWRLK
jgi:bifunctional DNA-binding transcriptional regulator/antitoxin component of YhaV-PrlF toxin-antitoxin module